MSDETHNTSPGGAGYEKEDVNLRSVMIVGLSVVVLVIFFSVVPLRLLHLLQGGAGLPEDPPAGIDRPARPPRPRGTRRSTRTSCLTSRTASTGSPFPARKSCSPKRRTSSASATRKGNNIPTVIQSLIKHFVIHVVHHQQSGIITALPPPVAIPVRTSN